MYMYVCMYVYVHMYACIRVCTCIHTELVRLVDHDEEPLVVHLYTYN